ncbi:MAG: glycosyltransferase family 4 protein [Kofleriaceae bacterium]
MSSPGVLYIGNFLSKSGNPGYCEELSAKLKSDGFTMITASEHLARGSRFVDMVRTTWERRRDYDVAIIDVFSGAAFLWAEAVTQLLRRLRKPFVLTLHGGRLPRFGERFPRRVRHLLGGAAQVTAPSRYMQEHMAPYCREIAVVPNAIDLGAFSFRRKRRAGQRLVWVRALHATYNPVLAVDVVARLVPRFSQLSLHMLGPDKGDGSRDAVERRARDLGISDRVHLVGRVAHAEVPRWLDENDILINTTDVDNTPVSLLEAMAVGLPIVSTSVGGIPYLVRDNHDALLVPPRDSTAMANAVEQLLVSPETAERLVTNAHETVQRHAWTTVLRQWRDTLRRAVHHA